MPSLLTQTFTSELREIARALVRAGVDRDLGAPKGANVKTEDSLGVITLYWTGNGKTFSVDRFIPARQWQAAKATGEEGEYIRKCIKGMRGELAKLKRDHYWRAA